MRKNREPKDDELDPRVLALLGVDPQQLSFHFTKLRWIVRPPASLENATGTIRSAFYYRPEHPDPNTAHKRDLRGQLCCHAAEHLLALKCRVFPNRWMRLRALYRLLAGRTKLHAELRGMQLAERAALPVAPLLAAGWWSHGPVIGGHMLITQWIDNAISLKDYLRHSEPQTPERTALLEQFVDLIYAIRTAGLFDDEAGAGHFLVRRSADGADLVWIDQEHTEPVDPGHVQATAFMAAKAAALGNKSLTLSEPEQQMLSDRVHARAPVSPADRASFERYLKRYVDHAPPKPLQKA